MAKDHVTAEYNDATTSINQLKQLVSAFIREREWEKYHTPKNIAVSVVLEASELLEHFQWSPPAPEALDETKRQQIGEELSDVLAYLLSLANVLKIDVSSAMAAKMQKNKKKYPAEQFQGNWEKAKN
ncbi:MAG: nucleotide pyrophosphohydrolase [Candidatus Rifleibacteriota bacterium]